MKKQENNKNQGHEKMWWIMITVLAVSLFLVMVIPRPEPKFPKKSSPIETVSTDEEESQLRLESYIKDYNSPEAESSREAIARKPIYDDNGNDINPLSPTYYMNNMTYEEAERIEASEKEKLLKNKISYEDSINEETSEEIIEEDSEIISYEGYDFKENAYLVAAAMVNEAATEPDYFKKMVGSVVINRVNDERFPDSYYDVLSQPGAYENLQNHIPYISEYMDSDNREVFLHSYELAEELLSEGSLLPNNVTTQSGYILGDIYTTYYSEVCDTTTYFCIESWGI